MFPKIPHAKAIYDKLNLRGTVEPRHLPSHCRYDLTFSKDQSNQTLWTFNPKSLANLASTLVVANVSPVTIQK